MAIKLFFLDMEGTLVSKQRVLGAHKDHGNSLWSRIFYELGEEALHEDLVNAGRFEAGDYNSYMDFAAESIEIMKRYGLRRSLFERLIEETALNPGVKEAISEMHKMGIKTAIISGGFFEQAEKIQTELLISHAYASTRIYWNDDGSLRHANNLPADYEAKVDFVELLRREYNFTLEECAFVGDGKNDVQIVSHVGTSFAFEAHQSLKQAATHVIEDFCEIVPLLDNTSI